MVLYKFDVISYFPEGLAVSPDGKQLYVASAGYPAIISTLAMKLTIPFQSSISDRDQCPVP